MEKSNYERASELIVDIWRGLNTSGTTFGSCSHPLHESRGHKLPARGSGSCVDCCASDLEAIAGEPARDFVKAARTAKMFQQRCEEIAEDMDHE